MKKVLLTFSAFTFLSLAAFSQNNVGIGTSTPKSKLDVNGSLATKTLTVTTNTTLDETSNTIIATPGTYTITLPTISSSTGRIYTIVYDGAPGGSTITIKGNGTENVRNSGTSANTLALNGGTLIIQNNGTEWTASTIAPASGSGSYIQNNTVGSNFTTGQSGSFDITGNGEISGTLTVGGGGTGVTPSGTAVVDINGGSASGTNNGKDVNLVAQTGGSGGNTNGGSVNITSGQNANAGTAGKVNINALATSTGDVNISNGTANQTVNIGNNASGVKTVNIGGSGSTSSTTINAGTGGVKVATLTTAGIVTNTATGVLGTTATVPVSNLPDATTTTKGIVQLAGDLAGTAAAPSVVKINGVQLGTMTASDKNIIVANGTQWNSVAMSGDATISNTGVVTLKNTGTANTYGSATQVPVITTDAQGRVTTVTPTTIAGVSPAGAALSSADIWVGNASNVAAPVAVTGDITINNTGVTAIGSGKVTSTMILDGTVTSADIADGTITSTDILDGTIASVDITDGTIASVDIADGTIASVDIADGTVANVDLANMAALSVKGNGTNAAAAPTDIAAGTDGHVLRRSGTTVGFGQIANAGIATGAVTSASILDGTIAAADLANSGVTAGTYPKVTVNAQGQVTAGSALAASDITAGSGNYIQNQSSSAQTADSWISGTSRAGTVRSNSSTGGYVSLEAGTSTQSGYVQFFPGSGARTGYIGYGPLNIEYAAERGAHQFSGDVQARDGFYTKKSYFYATYSRNHNNSWATSQGANTYTIGAFDFCALAGQSTLIDEDDGDQTADMQCNVYTNNASQPAWGDAAQTSGTMNYDYASKPTWMFYIENYGSKWWADITCNVICITFDY